MDRLREQMGDDGMGGDSYGRSDAILRGQLDQYQSDVYVQLYAYLWTVLII